jgi:hypothetical protein
VTTEGAHREAVAKPPALSADGYPDARKLPTPAPPQSRKTHINNAVLAALANLPKALRVSMNKEKTDHNVVRVLSHQQHLADSVRFPNNASESSSLITILSSGSQSPTLSLLKHLCPTLPTCLPISLGKDPRDQPR